MPNFDATPEQCERLRRLVREDLPALTNVQGRQALMVAALIDGGDGKAFLQSLRAKASTVSELRRKLRRSGLEPFLQKWEALVIKAKSSPRSLGGKPGPEGTNTLDEWLESESAHSEPVFEVALLLCGPGANIAVFAVRDRRKALLEKMVGPPPFLTAVRQILAKPVLKELHWSRLSTFDVFVSGLLGHLTVKFLELQRAIGKTEWPPEISDGLIRLRGIFGPDYEFFILVEGEIGERSIAAWCRTAEANGEAIRPGNVFRTPSADEFFNRLASTFYRLRERWSCPGLLPLHAVLFLLAEKWARSRQMEPFVYECKSELFELAMKHGALLWRYPAIYGALFQMNRTMWSNLPWRDEFSLGVSSIRPRVEIILKPDGSSGVFQDVQVVPEVGYGFDATPATPVPIDPEEMARHLRRLIRSKKAVARFFYSAKPMDFSGWEHLLNPAEGEQAPEKSGRIPAVLVPRHFVATPEELPVPLPELRVLAESLEEGVSRRHLVVDGESEPCLIWHAPILVTGIRRAYENNSYGDELANLQRLLDDTAMHLGRADEGFSQKRMAVQRLSRYRPSYWCFAPGADDPQIKYGWRWRKVIDMRERAKRDGMSDFMPASDDSETGFKDLLRDCDADFLLRGLAPDDRARVDHLASAWAECVKALIALLYSVDDPDGRGRVIAAIEKSLRPQAAKRIDELRSWVFDALEVFSTNSLRVTRQAIEVAQRCSMAGLEPIAIVVESESSVLRRWAAFLGKRLRSRLMPRRKSFGIGASPEFDDPFEDNISKIKAVAALVRALAERPRDSKSAEEFVAAATGIDMEIWRDVLQEFSGQDEGGAIKDAVLDGLRICRGKVDPDATLESRIAALMDRFEKLRHPLKPAFKRRKPPNPGG